MGSTQISRSAKGRKVTAKAVKNTAAKAVKTATTVANGKKGKKGMKNPSAMTKGLKVAKQQPKKEAASKVLAKKEADQSRARINALPKMKECVIDEWYWGSEERTELTLDAAEKFADAVQQMHNGDPALYLELYKDDDMRPVLDVLTNLQSAHQVLVGCEERAKVACLRLLDEYTEYPMDFTSSKPFAYNRNVKRQMLLFNPHVVSELPGALRDRIRNAAVGIKVGKMSETENELVKIVKDALAANELIDLILSLQWPDAIDALLFSHPEFDEFGDHGGKL